MDKKVKSNIFYHFKLYHNWSKGSYTIKVKARDIHGAESDWGILEITIPIGKLSIFNILLQQLLEGFPNMFLIIRYLL
jgi:hypothetical protein